MLLVLLQLLGLISMSYNIFFSIRTIYMQNIFSFAICIVYMQQSNKIM
jgi:hypothetical protein